MYWLNVETLEGDSARGRVREGLQGPAPLYRERPAAEAGGEAKAVPAAAEGQTGGARGGAAEAQAA